MSKPSNRFFATRSGIILAGAVIGVLASMLQYYGNPPNMGICVACFERDIAGALGLHRASVVQYIRPEIIGFVLGSTLAALLFREFRARAGSAPLIRFVLGAFAMIGALAFLGCSWRACLRLAGGDLNAATGLVGLVAGILLVVLFQKRGYSLGRPRETSSIVAWIMPAAMAGLLLLLLFKPEFSKEGPVFFSAKGPGAMFAPLWLSLGAGLAIGFLAQRTRFCTVGAFRDILFSAEILLLLGVAAFIIAAFLANLVLGQVKFGFSGQPVAHTNHLWNFLGMALAGMAFALAGGCPGRQLISSGEGNGDAGVFVCGTLVGAGFAHNFVLAGLPDKVKEGVVQAGGLSPAGQVAVILGLVICIVIGFSMRAR